MQPSTIAINISRSSHGQQRIKLQALFICPKIQYIAYPINAFIEIKLFHLKFKLTSLVRRIISLVMYNMKLKKRRKKQENNKKNQKKRKEKKKRKTNKNKRKEKKIISIYTSILEKSKMSFMIDNNISPAVKTNCADSCCCSSKSVCNNSSVIPIIAFIGVLSGEKKVKFLFFDIICFIFVFSTFFNLFLLSVRL